LGLLNSRWARAPIEVNKSLSFFYSQSNLQNEFSLLLREFAPLVGSLDPPGQVRRITRWRRLIAGF
jgi:hypothetical protein